MLNLDRGHLQGLIHETSGPDEGPPAIYLPGSHGDPSMLAPARQHLNRELRLHEVTYPRAAEWRLPRYASALEDLMDVLELESAHLIGESFGSMVGLEFGLAHPGRVRSLTMVGGFCHPVAQRRSSVARRALSHVPGPLLERGLELYTAFRGSRGAVERDLSWAAIPHVASQSHRTRRAVAGRLAEVGRADYRSVLHRVRFEVRYLGGGADTAVAVRREISLLRNRLPEPARFRSHVIAGAPHAVLSTHPRPSAERIVGWIARIEAAALRTPD